MAIDTRDKRASAMLVGLPFRGLLPLADGSVDATDRPHLAFLYRLEADAPPEPVLSSDQRARIFNLGRMMGR